MSDATAHALFTLPTGTRVADRFEIERCLGIGSMSVVYRCKRLEDGKLCALKVLQPSHGRELTQTFHTRFRIGARMAQQVMHPNVVQVYDFIDRPDIVACSMEYVGGGDLASHLRRRGPLPINEVVRLLQEICAGVQAIHDAGIVHRDLKPANILLNENGVAKITDFGIAKNEKSPRLTARGGVVGTLQYVSPEVLEGKEATKRSDIYAIGVIAYELLTGEAPYSGGSVYEMVHRAVTEKPLPLERRNPRCPLLLSAVVAKSMERDPEHRFAEAKEIALCLQETEHAIIRPSAQLAFIHEQERAEVGKPRGRLSLTRGQTIVGALFLAMMILLLRFLPIVPPRSENEMSASDPGQVEAPPRSLELPPLAASQSAAAADAVDRTQQATFLYRLGDFVQWPSNRAADPIRLCLVGKDPFDFDFERMLSRTRARDGRSYWVQRFANIPSSQAAGACSILFVSGAGAEATRTLFDSLSSQPVLTVTDGSGTGMIELSLVNHQLNFAIDEARIRSSGLELSPILRDLSMKRLQ